MIGSEVLRRAALVALVVAGCAIGPAANAQRGSEGGHEEDVMVDPSLHRFTGAVKAIGKADGQGRIYTFSLVPIGPTSKPPAPGEWKGWRLRMLSGARFASFFEIRDNTPTSATVIAGDHTLNGLAASDVFIIESYDRDGHSIFASKTSMPRKGG